MKDDQNNVITIAEMSLDITQRKKVEEKIRNLNKQYQYLFENSGEAILIVEKESLKIIEANQRAVELYKYGNKEALLGISVKSLLQSSDKDFYKRKARVDNTGTYTFNNKHRCKNGDIIDVEVKSRTIFYNNNNCYLYNIRDITESLRIKEEKLKAEMKKKFDIAYKIQTSFIPDKNMEHPQIDIATYYEPAQLVGGDYFNFIQKDNKLGVIISDVMGKGITAALIVGNIHSSFHTMTKFDLCPIKMISNLNDILYNDLKDTVLFVTAFYGLFDFKNGIFEYTNAGHNPPIYWSAKENKIRLLDKSGILCGVQAEYKYSSSEVIINKDDIILFYTDGLVDIRNQREERYRLEHIEEIIIENKELSAYEIKEKIISAVNSFSSKCPGDDDISFVLCKIVG